jgi:imidazole glycerol-phosphate synthase subunit HisH
MGCGNQNLKLNSKVVVIDYGVGNIFSIQHSLEYLGYDSILTSDPKIILSAKILILPGVGSFKSAMKKIEDMRLDVIIREAVLNNKIPILGICLGMQLLTNSSTEDSSVTKGLGLVNARTIKLKNTHEKIKIPHIGFNNVEFDKNMSLFKSLKNNVDFYFIHSYKVVSNSKDFYQAYCEYFQRFIVAFENNNVYGVQFHPEKSQENGLKLLKNFLQKV